MRATANALISDLPAESFIESFMQAYGEADTNTCILVKHVCNAKSATSPYIDFERPKADKASGKQVPSFWIGFQLG